MRNYVAITNPINSILVRVSSFWKYMLKSSAKYQTDALLSIKLSTFAR